MSQDFLAALVRSAEVMQGNEGKKTPVQLHLLTGDDMSPELQELLASSGITSGAQRPFTGGYLPMDEKPCRSCACKKDEQPEKEEDNTIKADSKSNNVSTDEPVILITSHGRQYDSIKKFLASEGCRDINTFFDVWKNTDDIAKALSMVVGEVYEDVPVRVFNIKFDNYKEVCRHFYLAVSDVELYIDEAVSENKVTKEELTDSRVLSRMLSEIVFQLTLNVKEK